MEPTQNKVAKENSYYYWWDEKNKSKSNQGGNMNAPQKITPSQAKKLNEVNKSKQSPWNKVGTWEEKVFKVEDFQAFVHNNPGKIIQK